MGVRKQIEEILHEFYIEASTRRISREEFERYIDRIIALFSGEGGGAAGSDAAGGGAPGGSGDDVL